LKDHELTSREERKKSDDDLRRNAAEDLVVSKRCAENLDFFGAVADRGDP
jgi:hypothetical protein